MPFLQSAELRSEVHAYLPLRSLECDPLQVGGVEDHDLSLVFRSPPCPLCDALLLTLLIGLWAFGAVLQQLAGLGIDTDFVYHAIILDIEGIA